MTDWTVRRAKTATLVANAPDKVTFGKAYRGIEIVNRSTTDGINATVARGANNEDDLTPTVDGDDTFYVGPGAVRTLADDDSGPNAPVSYVRLVSSGTPKYTVTGLNPWTGS